VFFRIAQEALTNVSRHARASRVAIRFAKNATGIGMRLHDNGISFNAAKQLLAKGGKRLGLLGMRERVEMVGGTFGIESAPGQGTTIIVDIPIDKPPPGKIKKSSMPILLKQP
jgi:signal transduction histidine kinase